MYAMTRVLFTPRHSDMQKVKAVFKRMFQEPHAKVHHQSTPLSLFLRLRESESVCVVAVRFSAAVEI